VPSSKQRWLILFSSLVILGFQFGLFHAMQRFQARKPDFAHLYQAGRKLDHERFSSLIDRFPSMSSPEYSVQVDGRDFEPDTMHPPYETLLYAVLALLKFRVAYVVWWACNLWFLYLSLFVLWPRCPELHAGSPYLLILIATFFPVLVAMVQGQNSIMLLAVLALCYAALDKGKDFRAGFALAMGMFKFVIVIPMAFWLILEKRWRSLGGFVCGCVWLFLISVWLVGRSGIVAYVRLLAGFGHKAPEEPGAEAIMPNMRGLFHALASGVVPEVWLTILTLACSLALVIWVDWRLKQYGALKLTFAVQVLLACIVSYHFFPHDGAVLVLPLLILVDLALQRATERPFRIAVLVCASCVYIMPFIGGLYIGMPVVGIASFLLLILARNAALKTTQMSAPQARLKVPS